VNKIIKNALILTIITLVAGLGLGFVYEITKDPIAQAQDSAKKEAWQQVFPEASIDDFEAVDVDTEAAEEAVESLGINAVIDEVCVVNGGDDGYVITATDKEGYGGDIQFTMGIQNDGTLNGISILSISETAGLGMKAKNPDFQDQFKDKKAEKFEYTKTGATSDDQIDAISGATITTNAMTNGVNAGLCAFRYVEGGAES